MTKLNLIVAIIFALVFVLFDSAEARCKKHDKGCCRQRIDRGRCDNRHHHNHHHDQDHHHHRRWAYNVTCGQCVPFEYSGCGGDDNNFENQDDCSSCCQGTSPCAKYTLAKPPTGCGYKWDNGPDVCPRPRLECQCGESQCRPDSCRQGERCVAEQHHRPCHKCPCPQYRCVTDPCYAAQHQMRPCEKCVAVQAPTCQHQPCPLVAHRENHCAAPMVVAPPHHHCPHFIPCGPEGDGCSNRHCPAQPRARCVVDPCNCKQHHWQCDGRQYSDSECFYGRH